MTGNQVRKFIAFVLATAFVTGFLFLFGYVGCTATRIERLHGLRLPISARKFACRGDYWMHTFIDSGGASAFEMAAIDLPTFVGQLKIHDTQEGIFRFEDQIRRPWMTGNPLRTYRCASPTGDELDVKVWAIDDAHVGILLYTDWN